MTEPALLTARQAAAYLNVSRSHFLDHVRPLIPSADIRAPESKKAMPRWLVKDLDAFIASRRVERKVAP